jgi:hypothetical protein
MVLTIEEAEELVDEGFSAHWLHGQGVNVWDADQTAKDGTIVAKDGHHFTIATTLDCHRGCGCSLPVEVREGAPGWAYAYATGPDTNGDEYTGCCDLRDQVYVCSSEEHGCKIKQDEILAKIKQDSEENMERLRAQWAEQDAKKVAAAAEEATRPKPHCGGCGALLREDAAIILGGAICRFCGYNGTVIVR